MADHEQRLRELAYRLWEEAGYPSGRADEFWYTAVEILTSETRPPDAEEVDAAEPATAAPDLAVVTEAPSPPATEPEPAARNTDKPARKLSSRA